MSKLGTIAIDFDGVIHNYSRGWQDGSCYDEPVYQALQSVKILMDTGYSVFIFSTRSPKQIKKWLLKEAFWSEYEKDGMGGDPNNYCYPKYGFTVERIPFWVKLWNKKNVLGITKRKLPALVYVDDRAIIFNGNLDETVQQIITFKTYQQC